MSDPFEGRCHCRAIGFYYSTELAPRDWSVRACQCSFCRGHGAHCTSDPKGSVRFLTTGSHGLVRYSFSLHTAEFLLCRGCGVYIAACVPAEHGSFATINLNTLAETPAELPQARAVSYDGETWEQRTTRRRERWTPVIGGKN